MENPHVLCIVDSSIVFYKTFAPFAYATRQIETMADKRAVVDANFRKYVLSRIGMMIGRGTPLENVVFAVDCFRADNWRLDHVDEFKNWRKSASFEDESASRSDERELMKYARGLFFETILPGLCATGRRDSRRAATTMCVDRAEADDIIGTLVLRLLADHPSMRIRILSSDSDVVQLSHDRVCITGYDGEDVRERECRKYNVPTSIPHADLRKIVVRRKALFGDTSDSIKAACPAQFNRAFDAARVLDDECVVDLLSRDPARIEHYETNLLMVDMTRIDDRVRADIVRTWNRTGTRFPITAMTAEALVYVQDNSDRTRPKQGAGGWTVVVKRDKKSRDHPSSPDRDAASRRASR
jgi:hypothetical protein